MISVDVVHDDVALLELVVAKLLSVAFRVDWRHGCGRRLHAKGFIEDTLERDDPTLGQLRS